MYIRCKSGTTATSNKLIDFNTQGDTVSPDLDLDFDIARYDLKLTSPNADRMRLRLAQPTRNSGRREGVAAERVMTGFA